jgi:hypothetical protein
VTADAQAEALKTRITAYTKAPTLDLDDIKGLAALPAYYVELHLANRWVDNPARTNGTFEPTGHRLSTRAVAKTLSNGRLVEQGVRDALLLNPITLDGVPTDVRYESGGGDFEQDDEGYFHALTDWIFVR